jgi:hypothetical protein
MTSGCGYCWRQAGMTRRSSPMPSGTAAAGPTPPPCSARSPSPRCTRGWRAGMASCGPGPPRRWVPWPRSTCCRCARRRWATGTRPCERWRPRGSPASRGAGGPAPPTALADTQPEVRAAAARPSPNGQTPRRRQRWNRRSGIQPEVQLPPPPRWPGRGASDPGLLVQVLTDADDSIRMQAAEVLGHLGDQEAAPACTRSSRIECVRPDLRAEALIRLGEPLGRERLHRALRHPNRSVAMYAAKPSRTSAIHRRFAPGRGAGARTGSLGASVGGLDAGETG